MGPSHLRESPPTSGMLIVTTDMQPDQSANLAILSNAPSPQLKNNSTGIARHFVMGVVQTAEGLPLMHTVHPGNVAETRTLQA
jgi:hypothetical protein